MARAKWTKKRINKMLSTRKKNKLIKEAWEKQGRKRLDDSEVSYEYFKTQVDYYSTQSSIKSTKAAIKKVLNKEAYTSAESRGKANIIKKIKKDFSDAWERIQNLRATRNERGRFIGLELNWDKEEKKYTFLGADGLLYIIDITNSPENVEVYAK